MDEENTVAVIGIGCRFPGAKDAEEFWRLIINGKNPIVKIQSERSAFKDYYISDHNDPETKRAYCAGLVKRLWHWDNKLYRITDQEAEWIDPQQRFVLDCVHMAMEDAGLTRQDLNGTNTGVYIGVMNDDFMGILKESVAESSSYMVTGSNRSIISARVSYVFNLLGPSMTIDTACSSSLVAIHQATLALKAGDCDMAICGGVNIILDPVVCTTLSNARMLSPTGQCHSFTSKADGYTRGEGCGIVLLKRAKDVFQTGNKVWGLLGTGVNQDGHMATPITAPSGEQQLALLRRVYENFNVPKCSIQVIEAHGTGTAIGDPTECNALGDFFHEENSSSIRYIGSVKSNIGHLESAAGIAGLIKVLLMMHYEMIAPSLHVEKEGIHPKNNLTKNGLTIPVKPVKWILPNGGTRIACVNSFGFGGTNAHAIVQEYKKDSVQERNSLLQVQKPVVILLSGTSQDTLVENVRKLIEHFNENEYNLDELSFTSACKRDHFPFRVGFVASSQHELKVTCQNYLNVRDVKMAERIQNLRIVMVFCGVGTAWQGMCSELISVKTFETTLLEVDRLLKEHTGWSVAEKMKSNEVIQDPMVSHIAIFACQVSLFEMWKSCGISPDVVIGMSVGEVAAAYASEAISLKTAVDLIYKRSRYLSESTGGKMMVVSGLDISSLQNMCDSQQYSVCVAVHNSPSSATMSGDAEGIEAIKKELSHLKEEGKHILLKELPVSCAYHSKHVESAKNAFVKSLSNINGKEPRVPIISTVTGKYAENGDFITPNYWGRNMRDEVLFYKAIQMATREKTTTFLEIGPHPVLGPHLQHIFPSGNVMALPSMKMGDDKIPFKESLVELYQNGLNINWKAIIPATSKITDIPKYSFLGKAFSPQGALKVISAENKGDSHLYVKQQMSISDRKYQFRVEINDKETAFVYEHNVKGSIIVPGALYADIGLEIGKTLLQKPIEELQLEIEFLKTLRLTFATATEIDVTAELSENIKGEICCEFHAQSEGSIRARGCVKTSSKQGYRRHDIADIKSRFSIKITKEDAYKRLEGKGFKYGDSFKLIEECLLGRGESFAKLRIPSKIMHSLARTHIHPLILDCMLQTCALASNKANKEGLTQIANPMNQGLPVGADSLKVIKSSWSQVMYSYIHYTDYNVTDNQFETHANACLMDEDGFVLVEVENLTSFSKLMDIMVPRELKYFITANQLPEAQEIAEGPANIVLIQGDKNRNDSFGLESSNTVTICAQSLDGDMKNSLLRHVISKWGSSDIIFKVIFLPSSCMSNDKPLDGLQVLETVKQNCLLLVEVIRVVRDLPRHPPVIVVTENTQGLDNSSIVPVNVCGSELWGQIRCLLRELVYVNVFLVDVVDMKGNESILKNFLSQPFTALMACPPEIVITKGKLYGIEIRSASSRDHVSAQRTVCRRPNENALLQANSSDPIMDFYLIPTMGEEKEVKPGLIKVDVQSVCLPVSLEHMFIGREADFSLFRSGDKETDIESLEIMGFVDDADMQDPSFMQLLWKDYKSTICTKNGTLSDKVKVVVCYPEKVGSFIKAPRACVVRQDEIPQYSPGQLCNWIRIWTIVQLVQKKKKIGIFCDDDEEFQAIQIVDIFQGIGCTVEALHLTCQKNGIDNNKKVEIAVLLKPLEPCQERCFLKYLKGSNQLICMRGYVRQSLQDKIIHTKVTTCNFLDERNIFSRENLPRIIPKVVKWMKSGKSVSTKPQIGDARSKLLSQVIDIVPIAGKCSLKRKVKECQLFDKQSSYIMVGGLSGLGWILLQLLAEMGARVIVTISRRGIMEEKEVEIKKIQTQYGCDILCLKADISDMNKLQRAFEEIRCKYPKHPIRGIFQGGGIVDSSTFLEMTSEKFISVMLPKVAGSWNLHLLSVNLPLDYFVMHSSISGIFGAGGDSNYGAANTFMDSLAHYRRQKGLPGQSIDWGGLHVGLAATEKFAKNFESKGYLRMNTEQIRKCFVQALMQDLPQVVYTYLDWGIISKAYIQPEMKRPAFRINSILKYKNLRATDQNMTRENQPIIDWQSLHCADQSTRLRIILGALYGITSIVTNKDVSYLQADTSLIDIGIDSLSAIHYTNFISDTFKCKLPAMMVLSTDCTLQVLAEYIMDKIDVEKALTSQPKFQIEVDTKDHKLKPAIRRNGSASILDVPSEPDTECKDDPIQVETVLLKRRDNSLPA